MGRLIKPGQRLIKILIVLFIVVAMSVSYFLYLKASKINGPTRNDLLIYLEQHNLRVGTDDDGDYQQVFYLYENQKIYVTNESSNHTNAISKGRFIVWLETPYQQNSSLLYQYDVLSRTKTQLTFYGTAERPDMYENKVVWEDRNGDEPEIHYFDGNKITRISNNEYPSVRPAIYKNRIAYAQQISTTEWRVMVYDTLTQKERVFIWGGSNIAWPSFNGDKLVTDNVTF